MTPTADLVRQAQAGQQAAFAELVARYQRAAILAAWSISGDFHAAQDVAQEALVIAFRELARLREPAAFGGWVVRIARREALRSARRKVPVASGQVEALADVPARDTWHEPYRELVAEMSRLPRHEQLVVTLRYVDGLSVAQIAASTGRPVGTVTKQLSRAVHRLRGWLSGE